MELSSKNTANTSLALGNHNISQYSPNAQNNDSHLNQINDDLNNMSIFQKDFDNNNNHKYVQIESFINFLVSSNLVSSWRNSRMKKEVLFEGQGTNLR